MKAVFCYNQFMNAFTRISTGQPTVTSQPRKERVASTNDVSRKVQRRSPRARVNFIPDMQLLQEMVEDALTALSKGIYWDRGAIVDIVL